MILAIKEICIFMLVAQAILFFVPGGTYMKYVRILVGILMILRITEPLLYFFADENTGKEIQKRMAELMKDAEENGQMLVVEDGSMGIYKQIEEELKRKLLQCKNDYVIRAVTLDEENGLVVITVESWKEKEKEEANSEIRIAPVILGNENIQDETMSDDDKRHREVQELKEQYGNCIGVNPESIVIRRAGETDRR